MDSSTVMQIHSHLRATVDTDSCRTPGGSHSPHVHPSSHTQPSLGASLGPHTSRVFNKDTAKQSHKYNPSTPNTDSETVPHIDTHLTVSQLHQEMKQRPGQGPTSSYTNILRGVTVANRHSAHVHNLTHQSHPDTHHTRRPDTSRSHRLPGGCAHSV